MKLTPGLMLSYMAKREVLAAYVHRNTVESPCDFLERERLRLVGLGVDVPAKQTDAEWLKDHAFYVTKSGHLARVPKHCEPVYMVPA